MNFEIASEAATQPAFDWLPVSKLQPHPKNPRVGRPDRLDAIIESMRADGYRHEKPMLVRPLLDDDGYQIIGGHSRHAAAQAVGLEKVLCVVEPMDDETAILRIAQDNINDPLPWYSICLYVFQNAVKDSKTGLSRTRLVMAATGKEGGYAKIEAKRYADAGEVIAYLIEQGYNVVTLLDPDKNRRLHIDELKQAPRDHWPMLAGLLAEFDWSVKDTKAAVERVTNLLTAKPDWLGINDPNLLRRTAIEPGFAKALTMTFGTVKALHDKLPESAIGYHRVITDDIKVIDGREHRRIGAEPFTWYPKADYSGRILASEELTTTQAEKWYRELLERIDASAMPAETWEPVLTEEEYQARLVKLREIELMEEREAFRPRLIQGDVLDSLKRLPSDHYDLICIDPPYNVEKADWDSFGSGRDFAEWSKPWLTECQRVLKDSGALYVFGVNRMLSHLQMTLDELGMRYRNWITWDTIQGAGGGLWVNRYEAILYYSKTDKTYEDADSVKLERHEENIREYKGKEYAFKNPSNVWRFPCVDDKHGERTDHPTQKPVELIERIVLASSPREGRVLDCFMGSGTTGVACMRQRRYSTGIEREADYIAIANSRFDATEIGS